MPKIGRELATGVIVVDVIDRLGFADDDPPRDTFDSVNVGPKNPKLGRDARSLVKAGTVNEARPAERLVARDAL